MLVMKFGGTSVASAECMGRVAAIVLEQRHRHPVVVTSAMTGVTDALLRLANAASAGDRDTCTSLLRMLARRHQLAATRIAPQSNWHLLRRLLDDLQEAVNDLLHIGAESAAWRDRIASFGELLAVTLLAGTLEAAGIAALAWLEPAVITDDHFGDAAPDFAATVAAGECLRRRAGDVTLVMPGFIGRTPDGQITTLGRGGSDYSATLLAAALGSEACWIYTDVDGIFSADPRLVPEAVVLERISTATAGRLSSCGARILHPRSVAPAARHGFELRVRNTFAPTKAGTLIQSAPESTVTSTGGQVQVVVGRGKLCAVGLCGSSLAEIPHVFGRICQAAGESGAEIIQAAHPVVGHDPEIVVDATHVAAIEACLAVEFAREQQLGLIDSVSLRSQLALVSLIGDDLPAAVLIRTQEVLAAEQIECRHHVASPDVLSFLIPESKLSHAISHIHRELVGRLPAPTVLYRSYPNVAKDGEEKNDL
jgi:aspartate kinase